MKQETYKTISVRLTEQEYIKLSQIAKQEDRFISRQAQYWLRRSIRDYEIQHRQSKK